MSLIRNEEYSDDIGHVLINLFNFMVKENWCGACHACSSILYVALSELGYKPILCIGEVLGDSLYFDHSWIELNGKIFDLAINMTMLNGLAVSGVVIGGTDIDTNKISTLKYGVCGRGIEDEARIVMNTPFTQYMNRFQYGKDGLWSIVEIVLQKKVDIRDLRKKYNNTKRRLIRRG